MSASMTENFSRRLINGGISQQVHKDVTDDRYRDLRRPRKVRFFVNGDRFFKGKKLYITPHRYYNFNDLLNDLTGKLPSSINLPYGVRQIFTPVGGRRVSDIEDLQDGETYVCAGFEGFKVIKYGRTELEPWSVKKSVRLGPLQENEAVSDASYGSYKYRGYATNAFHPGRYYRSNAAQGNGVQPTRRWPGTFGNQRNTGGLLTAPGEAAPIKPKVITIIRNGQRPRNNIKILLNRRSIQSYEQLMSDISEAFGPKWKHNHIQRLFTMRGREIKGVADFFRDDDCFVALGNERLNDYDVADMIDELFPDSAYAKMLVKEWEKQRRKERKANNANKDSEGDKKDSGFVEGSDTTTQDHDAQSSHRSHRHTQDQDAQSSHRSHRHTHRSKRAAAVAMANERDSLMGSESGSPQGYYMLSKLERERRQAASEERDKARRRHNRLVEQERRALEEERRKRGLAPLNPFKPLDDIRRKDPKEKEEIRRQKEEEARRKIEEDKEAERIRREREAREQAEKAARERMAAAEKAERERQEKELKERAETDKGEQESTVESEREKKDNNKDNKVETDSEQQDNTEKDRQTEDRQTDKKEKEKETDNTEKTENRRKKEKDNASDKITGRKAKLKVVRRSKDERQISSDSFVTERYDLGRTLGDGNFAIVRSSRHKSSGQEVAVKVIDKPKLQGKEHMVENEIDIMKDCNHPSIVKLYEEYETADKIYLVMELVKGGDLFDAITQSVKFGETDSAAMVKDLCNALYYLHSRSIVHRDLKPENLLVHRNTDGTITLKLADFGLAMEVKENIYTVCGTPTYVAPEILTEIGYGLEVDMWAVGVITYILLCGFPPFRSPDRNQNELFEFIKAGEYEFLSPYWDDVSDSAKDLIRRLLIVDKSRRYTAIDVLSHPWIVCGGSTVLSLPGVSSLSSHCQEVRQALEDQAQRDYDTYQKLKENKRREE